MSKLSLAEKLLGQVDTAEKAVALTGKEREAYLQALDSIYGDRAKRAADLGFGEKTMYHGSPSSNINNFSQGREGLFGSGSYFTDSPEIASTYANPKRIPRFNKDVWSDVPAQEQLDKFNRTNASTVYPVKLKTDPNALNMDSSINPELWKKTEIADELNKLPNDAKNSDAYKLFQEKMADEGIYDYDASDRSQELLDSMGVSTIQHEGGLRAGKGDILHNVEIKNKPSDIRSVNAAFDPRFKDSDLIMSAKETGNGLSNALHKLGAPQRKLFNYAADKLGVQGNPENSEDSSRAIVQNLADRVGLPEDSSLVNAGKALGVAGLEVFGDPLNAVPVGPLFKGAKQLVPALEKAPQFEKLINALRRK